jgi:hypothetical protein
MKLLSNPLTSPLRRRSFAILALAAALLLLPSTVYAACNSAGCYAMTIKLIKVSDDGKIWFVADQSADLDNLIPADGCVVKKVWTGQAENALYIPSSDANRNEKYAALLTAFVEEKVVGFGPVLDPATGWCALKNLDVNR